jgi:hypothetical protein
MKDCLYKESNSRFISENNIHNSMKPEVLLPFSQHPHPETGQSGAHPSTLILCPF